MLPSASATDKPVLEDLAQPKCKHKTKQTLWQMGRSGRVDGFTLVHPEPLCTGSPRRAEQTRLCTAQPTVTVVPWLAMYSCSDDIASSPSVALRVQTRREACNARACSPAAVVDCHRRLRHLHHMSVLFLAVAPDTPPVSAFACRDLDPKRRARVLEAMKLTIPTLSLTCRM
ncbi:hypothetical protein KC326_g70 [Hortaea werneckii]|nr:hypothetical protein KC326_g70 [Hortaea werneckii]